MLSYSWAIVSVVWALVRAGVVWATLGDYSINPWVYLLIDLASALIDGYTTPKAVIAFVDEEYVAAAKYVAITAIAFVIPDVYLVLGGKKLPSIAFIIIGVVLTVTTTVTIVSIRRKVKQARVARSTADGSSSDTISR